MRSEYLEIIDVISPLAEDESWFYEGGIDENNRTWVAPTAALCEALLDDREFCGLVVSLGFEFDETQGVFYLPPLGEIYDDV